MEKTLAELKAMSRAELLAYGNKLIDQIPADRIGEAVDYLKDKVTSK